MFVALYHQGGLQYKVQLNFGVLYTDISNTLDILK